MNKTIAVLTAVLTLTAGSWTWAGTPKMKMTTPIPEGIETPNKLKTHLGTLTSFDGVPDKETTQKVYDDLDLRRATEAFLAALLFENLMDSKSLWLTPNTVSIYQVAWVELGNEPMVIETPPKVLGLIRKG